MGTKALVDDLIRVELAQDALARPMPKVEQQRVDARTVVVLTMRLDDDIESMLIRHAIDHEFARNAMARTVASWRRRANRPVLTALDRFLRHRNTVGRPRRASAS